MLMEWIKCFNCHSYVHYVINLKSWIARISLSDAFINDEKDIKSLNLFFHFVIIVFFLFLDNNKNVYIFIILIHISSITFSFSKTISFFNVKVDTNLEIFVDKNVSTMKKMFPPFILLCCFRSKNTPICSYKIRRMWDTLKLAFWNLYRVSLLILKQIKIIMNCLH